MGTGKCSDILGSWLEAHGGGHGLNFGSGVARSLLVQQVEELEIVVGRNHFGLGFGLWVCLVRMAEVVDLARCWLVCLVVFESVVRCEKNDWNGWWVEGGFI